MPRTRAPGCCGAKAKELGSPRFEVAEALEQAALAELHARRPDRVLATNVEFWSAVVLDVADIPPALAPAMFACSRTAGWSAHILEQKRWAPRPAGRVLGPGIPPSYVEGAVERRRFRSRAPARREMRPVGVSTSPRRSSPERLIRPASYRDRFPILADTTYLINHSLGAMPAAAEERLAEYARTWKTRGVRAWGEGWWTMPMVVGDQIGRIVGAPAGSTVMHQNVAVAEAIVRSCFRPEGGRNRVVYEEANFPSVRYLWQAQPDLEVVVVGDDAAIVDAIDERTLFVPISHVLFKTAEIQDVEPIVRRAHEVGAVVILDAYQSAGIVPLDVTALGVDFAVGGSVKWLCGGPGNGWLYVRPDLAERARAGLHGLAGARGAVRLRAGDALCATARPASSPARRTCRRSSPLRRATT